MRVSLLRRDAGQAGRRLLPVWLRRSSSKEVAFTLRRRSSSNPVGLLLLIPLIP
jgi:hypothetical protein